MSDLVGSPEDRFSHNKAQIIHKMITLEESTCNDKVRVKKLAFVKKCKMTNSYEQKQNYI